MGLFISWNFCENWQLGWRWSLRLRDLTQTSWIACKQVVRIPFTVFSELRFEGQISFVKKREADQQLYLKLSHCHYTENRFTNLYLKNCGKNRWEWVWLGVAEAFEIERVWIGRHSEDKTFPRILSYSSRNDWKLKYWIGNIERVYVNDKLKQPCI